jgi:hypothetical protein
MRLAVAALVLVASASRIAHAQGEALPSDAPPVAVSAGGQAALDFGDRCTREESDVVSCSPGPGGYAGGWLGARYRLHPFWSAGVRGSASIGTVHDTWWQASVVGRLHALGDADVDLWVGLDAGVLAVAEHLGPDELGPEDTKTTLAPVVGAGLGIDFAIHRQVLLGPSLRALLMPFDKGERFFPRRGTAYATQIGVEVSAGMTVLIGERDARGSGTR